MRRSMWLLALAALACSTQPGGPPPPAAPVPVKVVEVAPQEVPLSVAAPGVVQAINSVEVLPRVSGQVEQIHFSEGAEVIRGQLLVTIDPAPFEERLRLAEARLERDRARARFLETEAERYRFLVAKGAVSASEEESVAAEAEALRATVRADEAEVESARLELSFCAVRSPIDGRAGAYLGNQGAVVERHHSPLVVINQLEPIYVTFSIPEDHLAEVHESTRQGRLEVIATLAGGEQVAGELSFIDNAIDSGTGMIQLKATFANHDKQLWPGRFVTAELIVGRHPDAVTIPSSSVQTGADGPYVFVVRDDLTAEVRLVETGQRRGGNVLVTAGLQAADRVVTEGQNKLRDGAAVAIADDTSGARQSGQTTG